jgi:hypothetical protein
VIALDEAVVDELSWDATNRDYLTLIAKITVFASPWIEHYGRAIFRERVDNKYYTPSRIASLTEADKFPQVFGDSRVKEDQKAAMAIFITKKINEEIERIVYSMLLTGTSHINKLRRDLFYVNINLPARQCEDNHDLIHYEEDGKNFCFSIRNLQKRFISGDNTNPETGNELRAEFVVKIEEFEEPAYIDEVVKEVVEELAVGLLDNIMADVNDMEKELVSGKDGSGVASQLASQLASQPACHYCHNVINNLAKAHNTVIGNNVVTFCSSECVSKQSFK